MTAGIHRGGVEIGRAAGWRWGVTPYNKKGGQRKSELKTASRDVTVHLYTRFKNAAQA